MTKGKPYKTRSEPDRKPMYMGKTLAVMWYCIAAVAGLAAVGMAWVVIDTYKTGGPLRFSSGPSLELFVLSLVLIELLAIAVAGLFMPTVYAEHPRFRPENMNSHERLNASWRRNFDWAWRRKAVEQAPITLRRGIRFCRWCGIVIPLGWFGFVASTKLGWVPSPLVGARGFTLGLFGQYDALVVFGATCFPIWILKDILTYRAIKLYERDLRRAATNTSHCPGCDYQIDQDRPMPVCPECGFDLSR